MTYHAISMLLASLWELLGGFLMAGETLGTQRGPKGVPDMILKDFACISGSLKCHLLVKNTWSCFDVFSDLVF